MKEIIYNEDNLNVNDINNVVERAKAIIVNSKGEILLGYGNNNYQIIGGHKENNETYKDCPSYQMLRIVIPVVVDGEDENIIDDFEFFYIGL